MLKTKVLTPKHSHSQSHTSLKLSTSLNSSQALCLSVSCTRHASQIFFSLLILTAFEVFFVPFSLSLSLSLSLGFISDWVLESFGDELDAPPRFRDKNHLIQVEDEEDEDEDDDNDASGGAFGSHDDIDFNFLYNKWGLGLKT